MSDSLAAIRADLRQYLLQRQARGERSVHFDPAHRPTAAAFVLAPRTGEPPSLASAPATTDDDRAARLAALDADSVRGCTRCKLHGGRTHTVFGIGNPQATLLLVGEAPGRDEDLQGEPFVGAAGQLLNKILAAIEFRREDVYIANILKCRPPNNRDPQADEVEACLPNLLGQLDIIRPRVILALGRIAAQNLLGTTAPLGSLRGRVHDYHGIPLMVTYHPAALLRDAKWKRPTWEDVQKLRALHDELLSGGT
jgi:DNA polymerase